MVIERTYNIPLRKEWLKTPKYKRAKKAVTAVKQFLSKHLHQEDMSKIKLGEHLNLEAWKHGMKNPPHHVKVNVKKTNDGLVLAELFGYEIKLNEKSAKEEKKKTAEKKSKETEKEKKTVKKEESKTNEAENKELEKTVENLEIKKPEQKKNK